MQSLSSYISIFRRTGTNNFTMYMEIQKKKKKTQIAKAILRKKMELEESTCLTSGYTTKLQSSRQYDIATKTEIYINGTK